MVSLRLFLLVVTVLVSKELAGDAPTMTFGHSLLTTLAALVGVGLLVKVAVLRGAQAWQATERDWAGDQRLIEQSANARSCCLAIWGVLLPVTLVWGDWAAWSQLLLSKGYPNLLSVGMLFAPTVLLLALIESVDAQLDELLGKETKHWTEAWLLRLRLGEFSSFVTCLAPILLISSCIDLLSAAFPQLSTANVAILATVCSALLIVLVYPLWLSHWFGAKQLSEGETFSRLESYRKSVGVGKIIARVVPSGGRWRGAAVVGWLPGVRSLWLGDGLLSQLTDKETDMVILHELAHVKKMHFIWRFLPVIWASGIAGAYLLVANQLVQDEFWLWLLRATSFLLAAAILLIGLGNISWHCEIEADRTACEFAEECCEWSKGMPGEPVIQLASALNKLLGENAHTAQRTWLHPSLRERLRALAKSLSDRKSSLLDMEASKTRTIGNCG